MLSHYQTLIRAVGTNFGRLNIIRVYKTTCFLPVLNGFQFKRTWKQNGFFFPLVVLYNEQVLQLQIRIRQRWRRARQARPQRSPLLPNLRGDARKVWGFLSTKWKNRKQGRSKSGERCRAYVKSPPPTISRRGVPRSAVSRS